MRNKTLTLSTIGLRRRDALATEDAPRMSVTTPLVEQMPLTAALLKVAATAVSFATPGHRSGRSRPQT
jgi:hypothetical protein